MKDAEPFERILDAIPDAVIKVDSRWRITYANGSAAELLGAERNLIGSALRDVLPSAVAGILFEAASGAPAQADLARTTDGKTTCCHVVAEGTPWDHQVRFFRSDSELAIQFTRSTPSIERRQFSGDSARGKQEVTDASIHTPEWLSPTPSPVLSDADSLLGEQNFRTLADATPQIVWTIALDGTVLYLNEPGRMYFGVDDMSPPFDWGTVLYADDRQSARAAWQEAIEMGHAFEDEFRLLRHDGTFRWHLGRALPVVDDDGEIRHWCGTSTDIHDLKSIQSILEEREERFRTLADSAPVMIWMTDETKAYTYFNRGWLRFTGKTLEEESGIGWVEGLHPEDVERFFERFNRAFEEREPFALEYRLLRHDGHYRWILDHGTPIFDTGGAFSGYIGSCIDIHERRQLEDQVRFLAEANPILNSSLDYESTLQTIAHLMVPEMADWCAVDMLTPDQGVQLVAIAHIDPEKVTFGRELRKRYPIDFYAPQGVGNVIRTGRAELYPEITDEILERNARDEEYLRITRSIGFRSALIVPLKARGQTLGAITLVWSDSDRKYAESDQHFMEELARRAATVIDNARLYMEAGAARYELERLNETLEARVVERTNALTAANDSLLEEIEERRRAQMETSRLNRLLKLRNRELQDFAHVASHDLQEPLRKILSFSSLLLEEYGRQLNGGQVYLERIEQAADRMMRLIHDLLAFSRVESKGDVFRIVDLQTVAKEVLTDLDFRLAETGGRVEIGQMCSVEADPVQMRQLFLNLIGNALKFHCDEQPPIVHVRARREGSICVIEVEDNGIGFNEAYLERIFSPFQRLHERSAYPGTGMGLAICRRIVERHEGMITARSSSGNGSTFIVRLPLQNRSLS